MGKIELDHTGSGSGVTLSSDGTDLLLDGSAIGGGGGSGDLLAANNLSDVANAGTARTNLGLAIGSNVQAYSSVLAGTTASYTTALNTKLSGIEASADVTDTANVTAAGALMDSEVTNLAQVKAFSASDYATAAQGATADAALPKAGGAMTGAITSSSNGAIELDPNGSGKVTFKGNATRGAGQFVLNCENNSHGITVKGPPHSANADYTLTLPNDDGASGQSLISDGSGVTSWSTITSNATHTGEVTGSTSLTIADNVVDEANLKVSNSPTNGYVLTAQSGNTGGLTWAAVGGGGGAWNLISTTTVTSNVSTVDFTSIGTYKRYVLKWDCTMNSAALVTIRIYDNGSLVTSSDYVGMRGAMASYLAVQTASTRWLTSTGMTTQIGHLEISAVEPRLPFKMEVGGLSGTGNNGDISFSTGGLKSTYSLTSFSGLQLGTTGTNDIATGRFALYGLSQ